MPDRAVERSEFLIRSGWSGSDVIPLAGDASNRLYFRVHGYSGSTILMDAPPGTNKDTAAFISVDQILVNHGLSAPKILTEDNAQGFLLLEDLGDDLFSEVLSRAPNHEELLYRRAVDVLVWLARRAPPKDLPTYDLSTMVELAALPYEWYEPGPSDAFRRLLREELEPLLSTRLSIALRDFHIDNLLWLPEREGLKSVGLLDFQDAAVCHAAYDLVSLLRDVRRDVPKELRENEMARFQIELGLETESFQHACRVLSIQRNMRILGVFARLSKRDGKERYLDYLPRVWRILMEDLAHPDLAELEAVIRDTLPSPDASKLNALR